jgi:hypothetical protein
MCIYMSASATRGALDDEATVIEPISIQQARMHDDRIYRSDEAGLR